MPTTPTANITSKCSPNPQTPSRRPEYDSQAHFSQPTTASSPQASLTSHLDTDLTSSHNSAQGPSHHSCLEKDVNANRPRKRRRTSRPADMAAERASSSSDSSSQSGMADNETEAERSQHSERSAPQATAPPKKKRTRTLTTPHQSAVLHALLSKSRFPTTAMREEVGRQIGLSARKVQIWFQNQRQKARRPQSDSAPLTRPPQFGPFPITAAAGPSSFYSSTSASTPSSEVPLAGPSTSRPVVHESKRSLDSNPALSGPGILGWPSPHLRGPPSVGEGESPRRPPTSPFGNPQHHLPSQLPDISPGDSRGTTRGPAPPPAQPTHIETSPRFSRVLPPINLSPLESRSSTESYVSAASPFPPQPPSRTSSNIVQYPDSSTRSPSESGSPVHLGISPPFALQPQPQWDPQSFVPYTRPEFASWSQTSGLPSTRTSFSTIGTYDRAMRNMSPGSSRGRHFYSSSGESHRAAHLDQLPHHIILPSRGHRFSTSVTSSRASASGEAHARSDDEAREG